MLHFGNQKLQKIQKFEHEVHFFLVFLVILLQKFLSNFPILLYLSNMPKLFFNVRSFYHTKQKKLH